MPSSTYGCSSSGSSWEPGWSGSSSWTRGGARSEVDAVERPREAAWLSAVMREDGYDVSPEAADRLLLLHRAYLDAPPPDAPTGRGRRRAIVELDDVAGDLSRRVRARRRGPARYRQRSPQRRPVRRRRSRRSTRPRSPASARPSNARSPPKNILPTRWRVPSTSTQQRYSSPAGGGVRPLGDDHQFGGRRRDRRGCRRASGSDDAGEGDVLGVGLCGHGQRRGRDLLEAVDRRPPGRRAGRRPASRR